MGIITSYDNCLKYRDCQSKLNWIVSDVWTITSQRKSSSFSVQVLFHKKLKGNFKDLWRRVENNFLMNIYYIVIEN